MPRLIRRKPFVERMKGYLNPMDWWLWASEEMETSDWDSDSSGYGIGLTLNFIFLLARANSGPSTSNDDIFGDGTGPGWLSWLVHPLVWALVAISLANGFDTMARTRKYRLFSANVEVKPATSSVQRVKKDSSPAGSSPLRYLGQMLAPESADARAHPDKNEDVWELSIWDPRAFSLCIFSVFSPGHVLVYWLFLPIGSLDTQPSVTVFTTLLLQAVLSAQIVIGKSLFTQQAKDHAIIQKEVFHEYDSQYVHPRMHPVVRDVGTQVSEQQPPNAREFVEVGTPTTFINAGFYSRSQTRATPDQFTPSRTNVLGSRMFTPKNIGRQSDVPQSATQSRPSPSRKSMPANYSSSSTSVQPLPLSSTTANLSSKGGYLGAYSHERSPLKHSASLGRLNSSHNVESPRNSREMAAYETERNEMGKQNAIVKNSPARMPSTPGYSRPNPFVGQARPDASRTTEPKERFPKMRGAYY